MMSWSHQSKTPPEIRAGLPRDPGLRRTEYLRRYLVRWRASNPGYSARKNREWRKLFSPQPS